MALSVTNTTLATWFECDRQHVSLTEKTTGKDILDIWDGAVTQAHEDGFLSSAHLHSSLVEYANFMGATVENPIELHEVHDEVEDEEFEGVLYCEY